MSIEIAFDVRPGVLEHYWRSGSPYIGSRWLEPLEGPSTSKQSAGSPSDEDLELLRGAVMAWLIHSLQAQGAEPRTNQRVWSGTTILLGASCSYCGGEVLVKTTASVRRARVFEKPPQDARDIRKLLDDRWAIETVDLSGDCTGPCARTFNAEWHSRAAYQGA